MVTIKELLAKFARDAVAFGPRGLDTHVETLTELIEGGHRPTKPEGETLLKQLRGERCFATMLDVAELLDENLSPRGRLYEVQALIDQNRMGSVRRRLECLQRDLEEGRLDADLPQGPGEREKAHRKMRSEMLGLFGRFYKQRFVSAHARGADAAPEYLINAMVYHQNGYPLDPTWHGANLSALAWRAEREQIPLGNLPAAATIGHMLEQRQLAQGSIEQLNPWDVSALAQACMAQGNWNDGLTLYREYARKLDMLMGNGAAFMLMGDLRQLQEIWLIDEDGDGPRHQIVSELSHRILANPDGSVTLSLDALQHLEPAQPANEERLEAIMDDDRNMFLWSVVENLRAQLKSICRVRGSQNSGREAAGGSGFIVDGAAIGARQRGPVLVTNAHVLSATPYTAGTLDPAIAEAYFEAWTTDETERKIAVGERLWESGPDAYDIAVYRLGELPNQAKVASVIKRASPFPQPNLDLKQRLGTVVPIGHPGGRGLTYTLGSNPILDHDLHRDLGSPRVVHYKADTEEGSSGCPVFDRSGAVVAIHRKFTQRCIQNSPKTFAGDYAANEGIGIHAAARACRDGCRRT